MATAPGLFLNLSTGTSSRFAAADTMQLSSTVAAFAVDATVSLFDNVTTGTITIGGGIGASGTMQLGNASGEIEVLGDFRVKGTEYVETNETVNGDLQVDGASTLGNGTITDILDVNGPVDIDVPSTGTFALDTSGAAGTITLTATGAGATDAISLVTATSGDIAVNSAAGLDMDGTVVALDGSTSVAVTSQGTLGFSATSGTTSFTCTGQSFTVDGAGVSIDGTAASNFSTSAGNLALSSAAVLDMDGATGVTVNAGSTYDITLTTAGAGGTVALVSGAGGITADATGGGISLDAGAASNFTVAASTLSLGTTEANNVTLSPGSGLVAITTSGTYQAVDFTVDSGGTPATAGIHVYSGDPEGNVTGSVGDLCLSTAAGGLLYFCDATGTNWTAVGSSGSDTLQQAYDAGNTILTDSTNGTLAFTTGESTAIDFTLTSGNFLVTTSATGDIQFDNGTNNYLFVDGSTGATTLSGIGAALTLSTITSGNVEITPVATADAVITTSGAGGTVDINSGAGGVTVDAVGGGISIDSDTASNVSTTAADLTISTITSGTLAVTSAAALDMDGTAVTLDGSSGVSIDGTGAASNFSSTSQNLTISTLTSGTLAVTSAAILDLNGGSTVTMDSTTTTTITGGTGVTIASTANDIDILAAGALDMGATAGEVTIDAAATYSIGLTAATDDASDINFTAHGLTIPFNATTSTTLNTTAQDVIGALNELKADAGEFVLNRTSGGVTAHDAVYIDTATGKVLPTDADAAASSIFIGFARTTEIDTAAVVVDTLGEVTVKNSLIAMSPGQYVFLSETAGEVTNDVSGFLAGDTILRVGIITDVGTGAGDGKIFIRVGSPYTL